MRAQCIVCRDDTVLMVQHRTGAREWWCLPGGGIKPGESPARAAVRELEEECCVRGEVIRQTALTTYGVDPDDEHFTYLMDFGDQNPRLGVDPELAPDAQVLSQLRWMRLGDLCEVDRVFLWTAGLVTILAFADQVLAWPRSPD